MTYLRAHRSQDQAPPCPCPSRSHAQGRPRYPDGSLSDHRWGYGGQGLCRSEGYKLNYIYIEAYPSFVYVPYVCFWTVVYHRCVSCRICCTFPDAGSNDVMFRETMRCMNDIIVFFDGPGNTWEKLATFHHILRKAESMTVPHRREENAPIILTTSLGRLFGPVGTFSIFLNVNIPSTTLPKTTCFPSRKSHLAVVTKNYGTAR